MFTIKYQVKNKFLEINQFWLRDHCRCNKCYNEETKQRRYNLLDIPKNVQIEKLNYENDGKLVNITCKF